MTKQRPERALVAVQVLVGALLLAVLVGKSYGASGIVFLFIIGPAVAATMVFLTRMLTSLGDSSLDAAREVVDVERTTLLREKEMLKRAIKEFDADHDIGKVDDADYGRLRATVEARAVAIIRRLRDMDAHYVARAEALLGAPTDRVHPNALLGAPTPTDRIHPNSPRAVDRRVFIDEPAVFTSGVCSACQVQNPADARFCIGCGRPRAAA